MDEGEVFRPIRVWFSTMMICVIIKSAGSKLETVAPQSLSPGGLVIESFVSAALGANPLCTVIIYHDTLCDHQITQPRT